MAKWRSTAIQQLPELRDTVAQAPTIMALWCQLHLVFENAYSNPRNNDLIARLYSFADWCLAAPRNDDPGDDPFTAVIVAFYEHIPQLQAARDDMPRWFRYEDVAASRSVFAYHIGDQAFEELLAHMKKHKDRYMPRRTAAS